MIKSTHYLRIIKTAQLIVSGLYKPKNATNWNEQSAPLPTPNATLQQLWNIPNCARYDQLLSQVLKSAEFNKSIDYYKVFKILCLLKEFTLFSCKQARTKKFVTRFLTPGLITIFDPWAYFYSPWASSQSSPSIYPILMGFCLFNLYFEYI